MCKKGVDGYSIYVYLSGMSARVFHCPLITSSPFMHLVAVVERHSEKSKEAYPWINVVKDTDQLFAREDINLVVITTPNGSHYSLALEAMKKGKNGKKKKKKVIVKHCVTSF
jgi:predicted dehydrogenase